MSERPFSADAAGYSRIVGPTKRASSHPKPGRSQNRASVKRSVVGVRRDKAALSSGCEPHPATAPAGSNRSSHGGNEVAEAFD
jgi:hypothetical protein